jgi:hypothetical protein
MRIAGVLHNSLDVYMERRYTIKKSKRKEFVE